MSRGNISEAELIGIQHRQGDPALMKVRRDANHREIAAYLRARGVQVEDTAKVGGGYPDLTCGYRGHTVLVELKTPTGSLLKSQEEFISKWPADIVIARNGEEAMLGILKQCGSK